MLNPIRNRPRKSATVAIVVPHHRFPLTADEQTSLRHLRHHLGGYDTYWVGPAGLSFEQADFRVQTFPASCFTSIASYNRLLMTKAFYEAFDAYEYILVYQLDCLVFSGELDAWCKKGWDYVGAPWFRDHGDGAGRVLWCVGNGGLSLRHVGRHLEVLNSKILWHDPLEFAWQTPCRTASPQLQRVERRIKRSLFGWGYGNDVNACIREWLEQPRGEDGFWSIVAVRFFPAFHIPTIREALPFAFEVLPRVGFRENGNRLPFGCHAWAKLDRAFWEPYLLPAEEDE